MFDIDGEINCILPDNKFGSEVNILKELVLIVKMLMLLVIRIF